MAKIISVEDTYNWSLWAKHIRTVYVVYDNFTHRNYVYGVPRTVKAFMESHNKTTSEFNNGKLVFNRYE